MPSVKETPEVQAAIELLARHLIAIEIADNADRSDYWEDVPLVGEQDWERIRDATGRIAAELDHASRAEFEAAYQLLASRADQ